MFHRNNLSTLTFFFSVAMILGSTVLFAQQPPKPDSENDSSSIFGKRWTLAEMEGRKLTGPERYLEFDRDQKRISGSGGCNRFTGSFEVDGDKLKLSHMVSTQRACLDAEVQRIESRFLRLLETTTRFEVQRNILRLYANDAPILVFTSGAPDASESQSSSTNLRGTSWRLVKFQSSDETILNPDDRSKYAITFGNDERVSARIDCNRGSSMWKSAGPNQLQFGPMALTRMMCPPGSIHDRVARDWTAIRSYVIKDGHLFLSLMADGGIYEYEPMEGSQSETATESLVTGTISYRQRIALSPQAVVSVKLLDVSRADAAAVVIAEQTIKPAGKQVPIQFELRYDPQALNERGSYSIQARILEGAKLRFIGSQPYLVNTGSRPDRVNIIVNPVRQ